MTSSKVFPAYESFLLTVVQPDVLARSIPLSKVLKNDLQIETVPFLLKLLSSKDLSYKEYPLYLLSYFVSYSRLDIEHEIYRKRARKLRDLISTGIHEYLTLLDANHSVIKQAAIRLIRKFDEHDALVISELMRKISQERDTEVVSLALWTIYQKISTNSNSGFTSEFVELLKKFIAQNRQGLYYSYGRISLHTSYPEITGSAKALLS